MSLGDFGDLVLGLARDLLVQVIPKVVSPGSMGLSYAIDTDAVVDALVAHGFHHVMLKRCYVEKACASLWEVLERARTYVPEGQEPDDWERAMRNWDFYDYGRIVGSVQDPAWNAMRTQGDIENWAETLETLADILDYVADALDVLATFYPPFEDEAQAVHGLTAALDGIQILPRAVELGLTVQCLDMFGEKAESLARTAFDAE